LHIFKIAIYIVFGEKNIKAVKECLHPDVQFSDPQEKVLDREAVLKAAEGFSGLFETLTIRAEFGS